MANVEKFKYWCNKILPLVYDDSLSYYEFLGKVYEKLNETIDAVNDNTAAIAEFDQRINDFIDAETAAREGWEDQQERDRQSWEDQQERDRQSWEDQQAQKWSAFQAMFISEYNPDDAYVKGDLCSVQYKMYVANASTTGTFDPSKWDEIVLSDYLAEYVSTAAAAMQTQYEAFLENYQRTFGIIDNLDGSKTDAASAGTVYRTIGTNLFNINDPDAEWGGLYSHLNGSWVANAAQISSGYIPCTAGQKIYRVTGAGSTGWSQHAVTFWDASKSFISGLLGNGDYVTVPNNTNIKYFRASSPIPNTTNNYRTVALYFTEETAYIDYMHNDGLLQQIHNIRVTDILKSITGGNLLDLTSNKNLSGGYYMNGNWVSDPEFTSYYIPVIPGQMLYCKRTAGDNFPTTPLTIWDDDDTHLIREFTYQENTSPKFIPIKNHSGYTPTHCYVVAKPNVAKYMCVWYEQPDAINERFTLNDAKNVISAMNGGQWKNKTWYAYGTSITYFGTYVDPVAAQLNLTAVNKGIGGQGIGDFGATSTGGVYTAICNTTDGKLNADIITLETGPNDVGPAVPLGTIYDTGRNTLAGCLNDCIRYLQENTNAQIAVIAGPTSITHEPNATSQLWTWRLMMEQICRINCVMFIPEIDNLGYAKKTSASGSDYISDNIHFTNLGGYIYSENIYNYLKNLPTFKTSMP